jgi:hypothetical protein
VNRLCGSRLVRSVALVLSVSALTGCDDRQLPPSSSSSDSLPPTAPSIQPQFVVSGLVHLPAPDQTVVVGAARVEIGSGPHAGERYFTDERGRFALPPVADADINLIVSKDDFEEGRYAVHQLTADRTIDVELIPHHVQREWRGTFDTKLVDGAWHPFINGWEPYEFDIHRAGEVSMHLDTCTDVAGTSTEFLFGIFPYNSWPFLVQASRGGHDAKQSLPTGHYRLDAGLSGPLGGPCAWALSIVRPY